MSKKSSHINTINEVALKINSSLRVHDVMNLIYQNLKKEMPISFFIISSYDEDSDTIKVEYCVKKDQLVKEEFHTKSNNPNSLTAFTIKSKKEIIINDLSLDFNIYLQGKPQLHGKEDLWCESVLMFPLIIQDRVIGLFSVQTESKNAYSIDNVNYLRLLTPFIGMALNNAYLYSSLEEKSHTIKIQNKDIIDSINYAKRLQDAILPSKEFVDQFVSQNFIYYQPKDIVAGDFYWAEKIGEKFFIAAADSTGHGVPGAMVSVVCSNALNRTIKEFKLTETGKILDKTRELVLETFEKSASEVKDGMDISLLCIDSNNKNIFWSGANNPLWYIQDNELKEIKADKQPIGKSDYPKPFTTHQIEYKENTIFYLFTDGLADQFGGPNGKKFKYKQFSNLLLKNNSLSQKQQADIINKVFSDWKGDLEQVDDVCVIGIKL
ncbi:MAG: SpoIIE family protein phosphatase [Bacteroidia bacterium]